MSSQEFFDRLCKLLCELDKLVKEYFFGQAKECDIDCNLSKDARNDAANRKRENDGSIRVIE